MVVYAKTTADVAACWEENAQTWTRLSRAGHDVYRDKQNTPVFLASLPEIKGLRGLDVGCGEGSNTRELARMGARIDAIDVAPTFVAHANATEQQDPLGIMYRVGDATALPFDQATFDFATSFMCMMDIADAARAVSEIFRVIRPGGFFQFSILHPCFAPPSRTNLRDENGVVRAVELADYFVENDGTVEEWTFGSARRAGEDIPALFRVPRFHRTLSGWVMMLIARGFVIEHVAEPMASEEDARSWPDIADTRVVPLFLHIRVRKPAL
ncbi:class I SAM-dependent methyltransferase [Shimia sp.]|uniref:class I SAM-dependent methyltransferase n=1 Tax=Shimia sp. TaxID=1954381 RepID=UPI003299723D